MSLPSITSSPALSLFLPSFSSLSSSSSTTTTSQSSNNLSIEAQNETEEIAEANIPLPAPQKHLILSPDIKDKEFRDKVLIFVNGLADFPLAGTKLLMMETKFLDVVRREIREVSGLVMLLDSRIKQVKDRGFACGGDAEENEG